MLNKIISYSIRNKLIIGLGTILLIIWGLVSMWRIPIDAVPDITDNQVQIITSSPSLASPEVERLITFPIEMKMASIPQLEKVRSFSRFGLSVVTLVFEESADLYWARQQVNERLSQLQNEIPQSIGVPNMAPITTGLGEIYQYVVEAEPGYENKYSLQDLRNIQDWVIRRQLLGTKGVADVSALGGKLQQFQIGIKPSVLVSNSVSLDEIYNAVELNNSNSGGAYIEKDGAAYFIRTEGLATSIEDIENICIKWNVNGTPLFIKDVADVGIGSAIRYGATTRNGEGEVVSAIVMMLKGENSSSVISDVKQKISEIQESLPEGVIITPFLDRTKLVDNAIDTVSHNLIEGALIVIFVLILLLGNLRAGLIVASVIPLALLFALGMMNWFGVSGNLMSLGAIDFGLIVDGAIIIVEASLHHLNRIGKGKILSQKEMDAEIYNSSSKIRNSAAFGEIIILIVYIPLLVLVGTEGKMFRPMAQTVSFAILGAFILSLTYVPMMSSLFLSKKITSNFKLSDKIIGKAEKIYLPLLKKSVENGIFILVIIGLLFGFSIWKFNQLGGEFIPTLEEGDFAIQATVLTGSSLEATKEATRKAEKLLLENFPEVTQVVSKIGSGEIPTDPMPIEAADIMVILKDKSVWTSGTNREELMDSMQRVLSRIPGVEFGFQQPIQMRFNELMTGVRQDVAVKIYGEDLGILSSYAQQVGSIASEIQGASDIWEEEVTGVPQIAVIINRKSAARYGLSIDQINRYIQTSFAGGIAGKVYQGERSFDLVIRLDSNYRNQFNTIENLPLIMSEGKTIPLKELASIKYVDGPYQIQRDDTRRRIIVAFNVRNRDVESVVAELKEKIKNKIAFEPGYSISYGGQFENLVEARQRLSIAVPFALILILVLLFFTFKSIKQSILIFTAIPLSAIGGVMALWIRDMPFSISAGVGFIALFGVAVLNGIVLIGEFNNLKKQGIESVKERILKGARIRLRPVLMTASVASLGFLPMAISTSSGAEVQKPLATVVIGGLITATILTLIVLPILYYLIEQPRKMKFKKLALIVLIIFSNSVSAQELNSLESVISYAKENNKLLQSQSRLIEANKMNEGTAWDLGNTQISLLYGQYNSVYNNDNQFNVQQDFKIPFAYLAKKKTLEGQTQIQKELFSIEENDLVRDISQIWFEIKCEKQHLKLLREKAFFIDALRKNAKTDLEIGNSSRLNLLLSESINNQLKVEIEQSEQKISSWQLLLKRVIGADSSLKLEISEDWDNIKTPNSQIGINPILKLQQTEIETGNYLIKELRWEYAPSLQLGYFNQTLNGPGPNISGAETWYNGDRFQGFQVGIQMPILNLSSISKKVQFQKLNTEAKKLKLDQTTINLNAHVAVSAKQIAIDIQKIQSYQETILPNQEELRKQLKESFQIGEITFIEYVKGIEVVWQSQLDFIQIMKQYFQHQVEYNHLTGTK